VALAVVRRRRGKKLCACVACVAQQAGPSTSPLGVVFEAIASFFAAVGLPWRHGVLRNWQLPGLSG